MKEYFYQGPPYKNECVYIVDIDQFAILFNNTLSVFEMREDESSHLLTREKVDYLCTDRLSSCIGIYAECDNGATALAHMSVSCGLINQKLFEMSNMIKAVTRYEAVKTEFYFYGGTPNTFELVTDNKPFIPPENCTLTLPQLLNRDTDDIEPEFQSDLESTNHIDEEPEKRESTNLQSKDEETEVLANGDTESRDDFILIFEYKGNLLIKKYHSVEKETKNYVKGYGSSILSESNDIFKRKVIRNATMEEEFYDKTTSDSSKKSVGEDTNHEQGDEKNGTDIINNLKRKISNGSNPVESPSQSPLSLRVTKRGKEPQRLFNNHATLNSIKNKTKEINTTEKGKTKDDFEQNEKNENLSPTTSPRG